MLLDIKDVLEHILLNYIHAEQGMSYAQACTHAHTHSHAHMHTCTHTHTHRHTGCNCSCWGCGDIFIPWVPFVELEVHWFFYTSCSKVREGILESPCLTCLYVIMSVFTFWGSVQKIPSELLILL